MKERTNVIQFPKSPSGSPQTGSFQNQRPPEPPSGKKSSLKNRSLTVTAVSMVAIAIATGTGNSTLFRRTAGTVDLPSVSVGRGIASGEPIQEQRNAAWEKSVAESLASAEIRDIASLGVGHEASMDEKVRF